MENGVCQVLTKRISSFVVTDGLKDFFHIGETLQGGFPIDYE